MNVLVGPSECFVGVVDKKIGTIGSLGGVLRSGKEQREGEKSKMLTASQGDRR